MFSFKNYKESCVVTVFDDSRLKNGKSVYGHNWTQYGGWITTKWGGWRNRKAKRQVRVWIDGHSESYGGAYSDDCTQYLNCTFIVRAEAKEKNFWGNWVYGSYAPSFTFNANWSFASCATFF